MAIPFIPEPDIVLKARYHLATGVCLDAREIVAGRQPTPGKSRAHVFDFTDGLRLIISRETDGEKKYLHFSASTQEVSGMSAINYMQFVLDHMGRLGAPKGGMIASVTDSGILHFMWDESQQKFPVITQVMKRMGILN